MIDIIIPCYNAHVTIEKTLNSIVIQSIKDKVKVLLVDDASKDNYDSIVNKYKNYIDISVLTLKENVGPGIAREKGLSKTKSKYIMFVDSDDLLMTAYSLEELFNGIEEGYDYVISAHYNEKTGYIGPNGGDLHGKIYRRKYIEDNDIHFNGTRVHEDNYFNNYVYLSGAKVLNLDTCTYYYVYNKKSITNDNSSEIDNLEIYFKNCMELINIAKEKNFDKVRLSVFASIKYRYVERLYERVNKEEKKKLDKLVKKYIPEYKDYKGLGTKDGAYKILNNVYGLEK